MLIVQLIRPAVLLCIVFHQFVYSLSLLLLFSFSWTVIFAFLQCWWRRSSPHLADTTSACLNVVSTYYLLKAFPWRSTTVIALCCSCLMFNAQQIYLNNIAHGLGTARAAAGTGPIGEEYIEGRIKKKRRKKEKSRLFPLAGSVCETSSMCGQNFMRVDCQASWRLGHDFQSIVFNGKSMQEVDEQEGFNDPLHPRPKIHVSRGLGLQLHLLHWTARFPDRNQWREKVRSLNFR